MNTTNSPLLRRSSATQFVLHAVEWSAGRAAGLRGRRVGTPPSSDPLGSTLIRLRLDGIEAPQIRHTHSPIHILPSPRLDRDVALVVSVTFDRVGFRV